MDFENTDKKENKSAIETGSEDDRKDALDALTDEQLSFKSIEERFDGVLNQIKGLVIRYLRLHSERLLNDAGTFHASQTSSKEVLHVAGLKQDRSGDVWLDKQGFPQLRVVLEQLHRFRGVIERRIEATYAIGRMNVMIPEMIQAQFQLSSTELLLLCVIAAPQIEQEISRLYRYATGLETTIFPGWFYADLIADEENTPADILHLLEADQPLRMYSLVDVGRQTDWGALTPVLHAPVSVPNRITAFLLGHETESTAEYAEIHRPDKVRDELIFEDGFKKQAFRALRRVKARVAFFGARGFGRRSLIREFASSQSMNTIEIDLSHVTLDESASHLLSVAGHWFREARLNKAVMIFRCDDIQSAELERLFEEISVRFRRMLDVYPGVICVIAKGASALIRKMFGDCSEIHCKTPPRSDQPSLWQKALEPHLCGESLEEAVNYISTSYCLTMGEIKGAIQSCRARMGVEMLTGPALSETLRTTRGQALEGLAELKSTPLGLSDIVLSEDAQKTIEEILNFARYSEVVSEDWGFSRMSSASGLSVLFSGPPGTGKTLTAGVLAHELKRALYVVDISRVVDKYIGETEKRLAKIFDHAQASQAILLFDEADSLFAKRTNVKSSNDRYANLEVNYLLQRLEAYHGVTILTTNLADSLDEALARRIQFKVVFPMPDCGERARLWQFLLPKKARSGEIDFERLGVEFEMSGGHIKNAVFRACIEAASRHTFVDTDMLWEAGVHEYREMGHVIREYDEDCEC